MKVLKILVSNSKWFRVYDIFYKWQIDDDREGVQILHFVGQLLIKITSSLKNVPGYVSGLLKMNNDIKIVLKPTAIKL